MPERRQVFVCRGVTCSSLFADDVFREFRRLLGRRGLSAHVTLDRGGCYGRCGGGVTVVVRADAALAASPDVVYPEVLEPEVVRIVSLHLEGGEPIAEMQTVRRGAKPPASG